ncbi:GH116 family glycosyl-hydrolase [Devosia sp. CN2-171]|uniref:GH116 family glycosyl-hydrolase n=1 Tax=Devosia sp. CN2-171 TaxID=3400909 RepID=UPI003BF8D879
MPNSAPFSYSGDATREISFPLGGIGTGSIGLSGGGRLIDWEIQNRPAKGITNGLSHFAVKAEQAGKVLDARILNGPYLGNRTGDFPADTSRNFGFGARRDSLAGMPHFARNSFEGRFPVAKLDFDSPEFPGTVTLSAFNPFIPLRDRDSSMPVAMFEIAFTNPTDAEITYSAVGVVGHGLHPPTKAGRVNRKGTTGVKVSTDEPDTTSPDYAEIVLATDSPVTSRQTHLYRGHWFDALEVYWKDLHRPGVFAERDYGNSDMAGGMGRNRDSSLVAAHVVVPPGESRTVRFALSWYAPNFRKYWITPVWHFRQPSAAVGQWKNWYATEWTGAETVAAEVLSRWAELREETLAFRDAVYGSTMPLPVLDAAAANLSILKSPTTLRLEDGTFYGWEGCHPTAGSCEGSCTHVWNYQQALPFLYPALERSMREADYKYNMNAAGGLSFRLSLPLGTNYTTERPCADGQFGNILKLYRDWKLSGDTDWLRKLWPAAKRSIDYAWSPENPDRWDPERTGVLWGRQHHTLDMELFGPNSWLTGFYLGALKAGAEMAEAMGEPETAADYSAIYERGRSWVDQHLFNGEYFVQDIDLSDRSILTPFVKGELAVGVLGDTVDQLYWSAEHNELKYQMGGGCLIDQALGQWHATLYGLGDVLDRDKMVSSLKAIYRHNFKARLGDIYNPCRVFDMDDESGTVIATWPDDASKPAVPVPYAQETMHGMEYAFGQMLMAYGMLGEGVTVTAGVRDRYDGAKRNPWNEIECGSNYARSMASWGAMVVLAGFSVDARRGHIGFAPKLQAGGVFRSFWSGGNAYGTVEFAGNKMLLGVLGGDLDLRSLGLPPASGMASGVRRAGQAVPHEAGTDEVCFADLRLVGGDTLELDLPGFDLLTLPELVTL